MYYSLSFKGCPFEEAISTKHGECAPSDTATFTRRCTTYADEENCQHTLNIRLPNNAIGSTRILCQLDHYDKSQGQEWIYGVISCRDGTHLEVGDVRRRSYRGLGNQAKIFGVGPDIIYASPTQTACYATNHQTEDTISWQALDTPGSKLSKLDLLYRPHTQPGLTIYSGDLLSRPPLPPPPRGSTARRTNHCWGL